MKNTIVLQSKQVFIKILLESSASYHHSMTFQQNTFSLLLQILIHISAYVTNFLEMVNVKS